MIENLKQELLDMMREACSIDIKNTPQAVFTARLEQCLINELKHVSYMRQEEDPNGSAKYYARRILSESSDISLVGLGADSYPHKDWIKEMAGVMAKFGAKVFQGFIDAGVSPEGALAHMKLNISIEWDF